MFRELFAAGRRVGVDECGNVAIVFALTLTPIIAALGSSIDYGKALQTRTHLQHALDAAVVGAAKSTNKTSTERLDIAHRLFAENFVGDKYVGRPTPDIQVNGQHITASVAVEIPTSFMGVIGVDEFTVSVNSSGAAVDPKPICLLALNETMPKAIEVAGTGTLSAVDCSVQANSTSDTAIYAGGTTSATAQMFCTPGGWEGTNYTPMPKTCGVVEDPYKNTSMPGYGACEHNNVRVKKQDGLRVLSPGVYCGGIEVMTQGNLILLPGIYTIKDGDFKVGSGAFVSGLELTMHMTGVGSKVDIDGGSTVSMYARTSGSYEGFPLHPGQERCRRRRAQHHQRWRLDHHGRHDLSAGPGRRDHG